MASRIGGEHGFGTAQQDRENGKRLPTREQLAALAKFFKVPVGPLEARRVAEDMKRYGAHPVFTQAIAILHEDASEYRVKKPSTAMRKRLDR